MNNEKKKKRISVLGWCEILVNDCKGYIYMDNLGKFLVGIWIWNRVLFEVN